MRFKQFAGQQSRPTLFTDTYAMADDPTASTNNHQKRVYEEIELESNDQQSGNYPQKSLQSTANFQLTSDLHYDTLQFDGEGKKRTEHFNVKNRTIDGKVSDTADSSNMTANELYDSYQAN